MLFQGKQYILPEHLTELDTKLWRRKPEKDSYHEYIRDNVKLWRYGEASCILSLEPEDSPHFALPVKYMNYESVQYDRQYRKIRKKHRKRKDLPSAEYLSGFSKTDRLMPVVTIGVYLGQDKWGGSTTLAGMTGTEELIKGDGSPSEIWRQLCLLANDFHVNLFDIHKLETSDVFRTDLREVFGFLKRQNDKEELRRYVEGRENFRHLQEDAYDVLSVYTGNENLGLQKEEYGKGEFDMCRAIQEMIEDGRQEGWQEGITAVNELIHRLFTEGKTDELLRYSQDLDYQKELMKAYGIQ